MNAGMLEDFDITAMIDTYVIPWGVNIIFALLIFFVGKSVVGLVASLSRRLMTKAKVDAILVEFIGSIINSILLLFVVIAALDRLGVNTNSLIALLGAAGLAIGLALQGSLQNIASGVLLTIFRPFNNGDYVEAGGASGVVEKIGLFSTTMRTGDNKEIIVPNGQIFGGIITNYSRRETRRIDMVFGIGYDDDIRKAKDIIAGIIAANDRILDEPAALIAVGELAASSVNFNVRPWVRSGDYWAVYYDLNEKIKTAFDENGISIPFPQMHMHLETIEKQGLK